MLELGFALCLLDQSFIRNGVMVGGKNEEIDGGVGQNENQS